MSKDMIKRYILQYTQYIYIYIVENSKTNYLMDVNMLIWRWIQDIQQKRFTIMQSIVTTSSLISGTKTDHGVDIVSQPTKVDSSRYRHCKKILSALANAPWCRHS